MNNIDWQPIEQFDSTCGGEFLIRIVETWEEGIDRQPEVRHYLSWWETLDMFAEYGLTDGVHTYTAPQFAAHGHNWQRRITHFAIVGEPADEKRRAEAKAQVVDMLTRPFKQQDD